MKKTIGIALLLVLARFAGAQTIEIPQYNPDQKWVTDLTGTLSETHVASLATLCNNLERANGSEMAVLVTRRTPTEEISLEEYVSKIFEKWGIGKKGKDNGVFLYISLEDKKIRIEVGTGNEGALPDITCGRIIRNEIGPNFRRGDFYGGINAALVAIDKALRHEYGEAGFKEETADGKFIAGFFIGVIGICVAITLFCFGHYAWGLMLGGAVGVTSLWWLMALCGFWIALGSGVAVTLILGGFLALIGSADLDGGGTYTPTKTTYNYKPGRTTYSPGRTTYSPPRPRPSGGGNFGSRSFGGGRSSGGGASGSW